MIKEKKDFGLQIGSKLGNIILVEKFIEEIKETYNISNEIFGNMLIAITEAVNNAIVHGNDNNEEKMVEINMTSDVSLMKFIITDSGSGFDFNNLPDPTAPENLEKVTGRGVFLMKHLSDMVIFSNKGSIVEIQFKM